MVYLVDRRTGFYYLGTKRGAYCYFNIKYIPPEFRQKPYITLEEFSESDELDFLTNLYNNGIYYININGTRQSITAEEIAFFDPNHANYFISRYITQKKPEDYQHIFKEKIYLLTKFNPNGCLSFATVKKDDENVVVGFAERATAEAFRDEKHLSNYELLKFPIEEDRTYLIIGCNHKLVLRKEETL